MIVNQLSQYSKTTCRVS